MLEVPVVRLSLRQRVLRAGTWTLASYAFSQALRFGSNLLMTRLLVPDMFGVMAIATVIIVGLEMFSDLGLRQSVVQSRRGSDPAFLNTTWSVQIIRGLCLWAAALSIALLVVMAKSLGMTPAQSVYADPRLPHVIAILSFAAVIMAFGSTKAFEAVRYLALGRVAVINIVAQLAGLLLMFGWAYVDRSIWALVASNLCSALVVTILGHLYLPGTSNRWQWDPSAFHELFHFGKWIFMSSILGFLAANGDRLLLGGLVSASVLGLYVIAFQICSSVEQLLGRLIGGVSFPALSEVARERPASLRTSYYRIHLLVASIAYFFSGVLMVSGQSLIGLLYDPRYTEAGWMLEVLATALLAVPSQIAHQCFMALGNPRINSEILAARLVFLFVALSLGFYVFGLSGALWGLVCSQLLSVPMTVWYSVRYGLFDLRRELFLLPIVAVGAGAGATLAFAIAYLRGH